MIDRVLVPMTDSEESKKALKYALSVFADAEITVLHVLNPTTYPGLDGMAVDQVKTEQLDAEALLERAEEIADTHNGTISTELVGGEAKQQILEYAEENDIDQIVMGSRGRSGISRLLLGSVAETVVRRSSQPVTVVR